MRDLDDGDRPGVLVDAVDHAVLAASRGMESHEFTGELLADSMRVLGQRSEYELKRGGRDGVGKSVQVATY
jgi:hypothetical protein